MGQAERRHFGYMPEERGLYPGMLVGQQVEYLAPPRPQRRRHRQGDVDLAGASRDRRPPGLKGRGSLHGNQQRVQPAAALAHNPDLLVLTNRSPDSTRPASTPSAKSLSIKPETVAASYSSSHQLDLVEDLCDRVTIIDHGRLVVSGTVDELATREDRRLQARVGGDRTGEWASGLAGVTVSELVGGAVRLTLTDEVDSDVVLRAAMRAGRVTEFHLRPPAALGGIP